MTCAWSRKKAVKADEELKKDTDEHRFHRKQNLRASLESVKSVSH
jgi:hypothetical protein